MTKIQPACTQEPLTLNIVNDHHDVKMPPTIIFVRISDFLWQLWKVNGTDVAQLSIVYVSSEYNTLLVLVLVYAQQNDAKKATYFR